MLGDINGDGDCEAEVVVGESGGDGGGSDRGAVWVLSLETIDCRSPLGDVNNDCRIDLVDFAYVAAGCLIECVANPDSVACVPHDQCSEALEVFEDEVLNGTTQISEGMDVFSCGNNDNRDVWLSYMATTTTTAVISLCNSNFDTALKIYDSCGGSVLACNDDFCSLQSKVDSTHKCN